MRLNRDKLEQGCTDFQSEAYRPKKMLSTNKLKRDKAHVQEQKIQAVKRRLEG